MITELSVAERWIWVGLLLMAGDSNEEGLIFLRKDEKGGLIGYSGPTISELLGVKVKEFHNATAKMIEYEKIKIDKNGVIEILNWSKYQSEYQRQKQYREKESDKENSNSDCNQGDALDIERDKEKDKEKEKINILCEKEFNLLWSSWPKEGRFDKKHCLMKLGAIIEQKKLELFKKVTNGYLQFLEHKAVNENFPQKAKHLKTWMNNWEDEREQYENFKYEAPL